MSHIPHNSRQFAERLGEEIVEEPRQTVKLTFETRRQRAHLDRDLARADQDRWPHGNRSRKSHRTLSELSAERAGSHRLLPYTQIPPLLVR